MKILTAQQLREADAYTIKHEPVASIDLMERAAARCVHWLLKHTHTTDTVHIYCGKGNNGGDGLAIARMLAAKDYSVRVFIIEHSDKSSDDFRANEERLKKVKNVAMHYVRSAKEMDAPAEGSIVIDAIFGSGLNKPAEGLVAEVVDKINHSKAKIIAIDIPSGLFAEDNSSIDKENVIHASHTLTFQTPKLAFMFPGNAAYTGDFTVLDIGLDREFIDQLSTKEFFITKEDVSPMVGARPKFSHKRSYGHALLIAGSYGKMGAAVLAGKGCLRAGTGLVTMHIPKCGYDIIQASIPEAMASVDNESEYISKAPLEGAYTAVGIGPGIGTDKSTQGMMKVLIQNTRIPMVFDADALNIFGENKTWLSFLPQGSILTPHPKEFERMAGSWSNDNERHELLRHFSMKHNVYVVLKGANTAIASPGGYIYFNSTGNPGMAKGGSGDVLTGLITGLRARGYVPLEACVLGVYLHGLAGDLAAEALSEEAMTAADISLHLADAWKFLLREASVK